MRPFRKVFSLSFALFAASVASAQSGADAPDQIVAVEAVKPTLEWNGRLTTEFTYDQTKGSIHRLGFGINRAFLGVKSKFDSTWSLTMLLDAQQGELTTGLTKANLWVYLRNAFFEARDVIGGGSAFRAGLQPTLYLSSVDGALKTRWLTQSLEDQTKITVSQGGGLSLRAEPSAGLKLQAMVHNGSEGFTKAANTDNALAAAFLLVCSPFHSSESAWTKNLLLHLGTDIQAQAKTSSSVTVTEAQQLYQVALTSDGPAGTTGLEWLSFHRDSLKAMGYGITWNFPLYRDVSTFFVRYLTGDTDFKSTYLGSKYYLMLGPTYSFGAVKASLLWEQRKPVAASGTSTQTLYSKWTAAF